MLDNDDQLSKSLEKLSPATQKALKAHAFDATWLHAQAQRSRRGQASNTVSGVVEPLSSSDIQSIPEANTPEWKRLKAQGEEALSQGQCALSVLAGGMATRMGGLIKALMPAVDGKSFLDLRLAEQTHLSKRYGKVPPLWLMTSHATHAGIENELGKRLKSPHLALFKQGLSVRLDEEGKVFRTDSGEASLYAPGHGDFAPCLQRSGLLASFVEEGGQYVLATNLDNLGGGLDPVLIGMHLSNPQAVSCEVVDKWAGDRGGIPARLNQRPVILEEFRLSEHFDPASVSVFNVNTFAFDASSLLQLTMNWTYFEVKKQVEGRPATQYERLINEVTFALDTQFIRVPRQGAETRFCPIKDHDELARRQSELHLLANARGML